MLISVCSALLDGFVMSVLNGFVMSVPKNPVEKSSSGKKSIEVMIPEEFLFQWKFFTINNSFQWNLFYSSGFFPLEFHSAFSVGNSDRVASILFELPIVALTN